MDSQGKEGATTPEEDEATIYDAEVKDPEHAEVDSHLLESDRKHVLEEGEEQKSTPNFGFEVNSEESASLTSHGVGEEGYDEDEVHDGDDEVPLFANRANRELNKEVKRHEASAEQLSTAVEETSRRVEIMKEHLKNVEQELHHTQQLLEAKEAEAKTEEHMKELSKRESGRLRLDIEKLATEEEELLSEISAVKNDIYKSNEKMDELKEHLNYDQEELEQWKLAVQQQDDDNLAYQKYTRKDESKLRELSQSLEKAVGVRVEKEKELSIEVTNTQAKQIELDKTAEEFRSMHRERKKLLKQWQDSLATLQRRDDSIRATGEEFDECNKELGETKKVLQVEKQRLDSIIHDNAEIDVQISSSNRQLQKQRDELNEVQG